MKAVKRIEELIELRKAKEGSEDSINEYSVIEAGFLYQQGNMLYTYIDAKSDVFGNIPALEVPESDDESEEVEDAGDASEVPSEKGEKLPEENGGEPRIEDEAEVAARKKLESLEEEKVPQQSAAENNGDGEGNQKEEENPSANLVEDATENILAAI